MLGLIYGLTAGLLKIPIAFLDWVVNNPISFTHQPVVTLGWQICRDLVNIGLVLALISVGIQMILRLNRYMNGKTLIKLIALAILVNFTPVLCGLIIDISTIIMNVFKTAAITNLTAISTGYGGVQSMFNSSSLGAQLAGIILNIIVFFVFLIYALIFIIRIPVLWVLVIVSPFALMGLFYQPMKSVWNGWFKQFFQWTIIGIPLFLFLFLAGEIYTQPICRLAKPAGETIAAWTNESVLCGLLSFLFPIFFLIIGLGMAFSIKLPKEVGDFANSAKSRIQGWQKNTAKSAGNALRNTSVVTKAEGSIRRRMETVPVVRNAFGGFGSWDKSQTRRRGEADKNLEGISNDNLRSIMRSPLENGYKRAAAAKKLIDNNKLEGGDKPYIKNLNLYNKELMKDAMKKRPQWGETEAEVRKTIDETDVKTFIANLNNDKEMFNPDKNGNYSTKQLEIFFAMASEPAKRNKKGQITSQPKFDAVEKQKEEIRKAFHAFVQKNQTLMRNRATALAAAGQTDEAERIEDNIHHVLDPLNANYKF